MENNETGIKAEVFAGAAGGTFAGMYGVEVMDVEAEMVVGVKYFPTVEAAEAYAVRCMVG